MRVADHVAGTSALAPAALPAPRALAVTLAGAWPCSTHATSGVSMSNWSVLGPAAQCVMPGTRKKRAKLLASPPFALRSDPIFSSDDTTAWYESLRSANGGDASNFARFFRVPGMTHCSAGPSTDQFDMLTPLVAWVEQGTAPASVTASARGAGNAAGANADVPASWSATRSRPLCPYPQVARYKGTGSVDSADSFSCQ